MQGLWNQECKVVLSSELYKKGLSSEDHTLVVSSSSQVEYKAAVWSN